MVAQTRKIKADCGVEPGASGPPPAIAQEATRMPALPPMPSKAPPKKVLSSNTLLPVGLKNRS
jgi:hypothetical protein